MDPALFEVIDATGGGCCLLRADGTIEAASPNFLVLTGVTDPIGRAPAELISGLPALAELPTRAGELLVRQVGADGVGRELALARVPGAELLLLVDRSGEARLRRSEVRLGRKIEDLQAELAVREREPRRPRVRSLAELSTRLEEALMRGRRYGHQVSVIAIHIAMIAKASEASEDSEAQARILGEALLGCVRGVDDLGQAGDERWILVLPHTDLAGGQVVGKRVVARLGALEIGRAGVGVAQVGLEEPGPAALERANQAGVQALETGGGLLLAVALV